LGSCYAAFAMGTSSSKNSCACGQTRDHAEGAADCPPTKQTSDSNPAPLELREKSLNKEAQSKQLTPEDLHTSEVSTSASAGSRPLEDVETASTPGICQDASLLDATFSQEMAKDAPPHDTPLFQMTSMTESATAAAPTVRDAPLQGAPFSQEPANTESAKDAAPKLEESAPVADVVAEPPKPVKPKRTEEEKAKRRAEKAAAKAEKEAADKKLALYKKKSYLQRHREEKAEYEKNKEKNMKLVEEIMEGKHRTAGGGQPQGNMKINMPTPADRKNTRTLMLGKFRAQYAKIGRQPGQECPSAPSQAPSQEALSYTPAEVSALTIVGGHQNMPRPPGVVLPADFRKPWPGGKLKEKNPEDRLATMTLKQLAEFGCDSKRLLCSVYGDIFDVSDRPDKYGPQGPYHWMTGVDITWGFVSGKDVPETVNRCYDLWKVAPDHFRESKLRTIYAWVGFYEWEYGLPIAKLDLYAQENGLKGPPMEESEDCCIM